MITVLRLGHRPARDKRITTHIGLVARAFNADKLVIDTKDASLEKTLRGVSDRFGGTLSVESGISWRNLVKTWQGTVIHLTMYGEHIDDVLTKIEKNNDLLIIVGSEKVPREIYERADLNIAIGHQPHSEVAALAVFLDRLFEGAGLRKDFGGRLQIIGQFKGKKVIDKKLGKGSGH